MNASGAPHIGLVEDNDDLREEFEFVLRARGYTVWSASKAHSFLRQIEVARTDIALLDLTLPDGDGLDLIRQLRGNRSLGLIVVSARSDLATKLEAMNLGADHYLLKPVDLKELQVTIEAVWRRLQKATAGDTTRDIRVSAEDDATPSWVLDPVARTLQKPTQGTLALSGTECALLSLLTSHAGELVTKERIIDAVYPGETGCEFHRIEVVLARLRQKARGQQIVLPVRSVFGKGLVFADECHLAKTVRGRYSA